MKVERFRSPVLRGFVWPCFFLGLCLGWRAEVSAQDSCAFVEDMRWEGQAVVKRPIHVQSVYLQTGYHTFETASSYTANPVIRVMTPSGEQLAVDDDGGQGNDARVSFFVLKAGMHTVYVHGTSSVFGSQGGRADLFHNGRIISEDFEFSGAIIRTCSVAYGDKLQTAFEPQGPEEHQMLVLEGLDEGAGTMKAYLERQPREGLEYFNQDSRPVTIVLGTRGDLSGRVTVFRNDAERSHVSDSDGDGLGDALEGHLGTCSGLESLPDICALKNPVDSDGDGLKDGDEVFGAPGQLALRLWGADPRRMDIFVELDYMAVVDNRRGGDDGLIYEEKDTLWHHMSMTSFSTDFSRHYLEELVNGATNFDGTTGIYVHFDIDGVSATVPHGDNPALVFDGGGSNPIHTGATHPQTGEMYDTCPRGAKARALKNASLDGDRRNVFFWGCVNPGGGGGAVVGANIFSSGSDAYTIAHELGHNLGLRHGGVTDVNGNPVYPSIMNYTSPSNIGFSEGTMAGVGLDGDALCEEDGVFDAPNEMLNRHNLSIRESDGAVDWNRNGVYESCDEAVEAPVNWTTYKNDGGLHAGMFERDTTSITTTPELVSSGSGSDVYGHAIFSDEEDMFGYWVTRFPNGACEVALDRRMGTGCVGTEHFVISEVSFGRVVSATTHKDDAGELIYVAFAKDDGHLSVRAFKVIQGGWLAPVEEIEPDVHGTDGEVFSYDGRLVFIYRVRDQLKVKTWTYSDGWSPERQLGIYSKTSPAVALKPGPDGQGKFVALLVTDNDGFLKFHIGWGGAESLVFGSTTKYNKGFERTFNTDVKPGLAWRPYKWGHDVNKGHWRVAYVEPGGIKKPVQMVVFDVLKDQWVRGHMINTWGDIRPGTGPDLLYDPDAQNLWGAVSHQYARGDNNTNKFWFLPYVDGHVGIEFRDVVDGQVIFEGVCRSLWSGSSQSPCRETVDLNGYNPWAEPTEVKCHR